jgi:hypothetical protein
MNLFLRLVKLTGQAKAAGVEGEDRGWRIEDGG